MKNIVMDCDPGIDDALAIILAIKSGLNIEGIIATYGNSSSSNTAINTKRVLRLLGREDIPVIIGQYTPANPQDTVDAGYVHGEDGLGNTNLFYETKFDDRSPVEFLSSIANLNHLLVTGPLTSLYFTLRNKPFLLSKFEELIIMGGSDKEGGNIGVKGEFNFYSDPLAADFVMQLPIKKTLIGLDITHKTILTPELLDRLPQNKLGDFVRKITTHYQAFYMQLGFPGCPLHDPLTVGYVVNPSWFKVHQESARVETHNGLTRGELILEKRFGKNYQKNVSFCTEINSKEFLNYFIDVLNK